MLDTLNGYGHSIDISILLNSGKTSGPNPEAAQLHNKLLIVGSEPSEDAKFRTCLIKRLTGGQTFS